jgi:hypothetical protein
MNASTHGAPRRRWSLLVSLPIVFVALALAAAPAAAGGGEQASVAAARAATATFHSLPTAQAAGYVVEVADLAGLTCIADLEDVPSMGAMGVHYLDPGLIPELTDPTFTGAPSVDATQPEALVYGPGPQGELRLVALEYLTLKAPWDATHSGPPELFGQTFMTTDAGNRYGLPAFYSLHAWIWDPNPNGMFEMWNPRVTCP